MTQEIVTNEQESNINLAAITALVQDGDLSKLSDQERIDYYNHVCGSMGLNPATRPFAFIRLNNKLTLYAQRNCTDQLMAIRKISAEIKNTKTENGIFIVEARATAGDRFTDDLGCVPIDGLKGENLSNAMMKAYTKAKRRSVLSLVGLSFLDETEVAAISATPTVSRMTQTKPIVTTQAQIQPHINELPPVEAYAADIEQQQQEMQGDPFIQHAAEMFGGEVVSVSKPQETRDSSNGFGGLSEKQKKLVYARAKSKGLNNDQINSLKKQVSGKEHIDAWDYKDLNKFLEALDKIK